MKKSAKRVRGEDQLVNKLYKREGRRVDEKTSDVLLSGLMTDRNAKSIDAQETAREFTTYIVISLTLNMIVSGSFINCKAMSPQLLLRSVLPERLNLFGEKVRKHFQEFPDDRARAEQR